MKAIIKSIDRLNTQINKFLKDAEKSKTFLYSDYAKLSDLQEALWYYESRLKEGQKKAKSKSSK